MIDADFYITLCLLAVFSAALAVLILFIFSKPLKSLVYILKSRKVRAEIINMPIPSENGAPPVFTPLAVMRTKAERTRLYCVKKTFRATEKTPARRKKTYGLC